MAKIITLVIPFHGIFLSCFLFFRSERKPDPNFFLGLLLLVLSMVSLFQLYQTRFNSTLPTSIHVHRLCELLTYPYLFLYTATLIRPRQKNNILFHLVFTLIITILLVFIHLRDLPLKTLLFPGLYVINGLYLAASWYLLRELLLNYPAALRQLLTSRYSWILILHLLMLGNLIAGMIIDEFVTDSMFYYAQLPKGLVIYFTYYRILSTSLSPQ
jgi:hypothetical protein